MRVSNGMRCVPRVGERELDGLRRGRRLAAQDRGIEVEKGGDEFPAVVQRGRPDELRLKLHEGFTEQPRLTLQKADERRQVAILDRPADLLHDETPSTARPPSRARVSVVDEVLDEGEAPDASIDVCAELGIERDGPFQQERRHGLVLEAARDRERFIDGGQIVPVLIERGANGVDVAKRRKEFERAREAGLYAETAAAAPWRAN